MQSIDYIENINDLYRLIKKYSEDYSSNKPLKRIFSLIEKEKTEGTMSCRIPVTTSFDASRGRNDVKISVKDLHTIIYGTHIIDLIGIEQLVDESQTRFIAQAIYILSQRYMQDNRALVEIIDDLLMDISRDSFDILDRQPHGNYAMSRKYELAAAINRLRSVGMSR